MTLFVTTNRPSDGIVKFTRNIRKGGYHFRIYRSPSGITVGWVKKTRYNPRNLPVPLKVYTEIPIYKLNAPAAF